jgi:TDG/mug DNA glycosylase family protein
MSAGFPPVSAPDAAVLILGSLPGRRSLADQQYYAQPQNAFWRIMGVLFDAGPTVAYAERLVRLTASGIALWDVLAAAERPGSLDSAIVPSSIAVNDFGPFLHAHGALRAIYFNGAKAEALYRRHVIPSLDPKAAALPTLRLPSTSPAHAARSFAAKLDAWSVIRDRLD